MSRIVGKTGIVMAGRLSVRLVFTVWCVTAACLTASPTVAQFGELIAFESPGNTTYYLDAENGDDEARGTRPQTAWKTLSRVNTSRFAPGDKVLIKAGTVHHGKLWPKGTGIPGRPITIDAYGDGAPPAIHGGGEASATILIENAVAWHVRNLEITNTGDKPEAFRYGVSILIDGTGDAGDFQLTNLFVHDVNGQTEPGLGEGAAISFRNSGAAVPTRFDSVLVEHCTIRDCGRNGIVIESGSTDRARWHGNVNVVIRDNTIENVGGDGIRVTGCDYAMVEYNTVRGAGLADTGDTVGSGAIGEAGGIAVHSSDNTVVQFNEVSGTLGRTGAALRCGENSRDNTFQFNFTHANAGPMARVVGEPPGPGAKGVGAGNRQTVVRYNISQDDGGGFCLVGPVREARLHNNTVYNGPDTQTVLLRLEDRMGTPSAVTVANNLFFTQGSASLDLGPEPDARLLHNAYFGDCPSPDGEQGPVTADPLLVDPGKAVSRTEGVEGYQTLADSPLRNAGVRLTGHGRYDFGANPVPAGGTVDIGAYQVPSDNTQPPDPAAEQPAEPARER